MPRRPRRFGRYLLFESFARGGMASVCYGRVTGPVGFSRVVAIKRHHSHLVKDPEFVSMMVDEGRLAGRIRHPSVVPVIDVVQLPGELLLVMDYVDGLSLAKLWRLALDRGERIPPRVATTLIGAVLQGLHCAHEMRDERGELCGIVHRDVSPQNIIVGRDGLARVTDFGIALARERLQFTRTEEIKGKLEYMAREQLRHERVDRRTDVYAASLVLWELLTGTRPFSGETDRTVLGRISTGELPRASTLVPDLSPELDALVARGLSPYASDRFSTAFEMAAELERVVPPASHLEVARWVELTAKDELDERARRVAEIEAWRDERARTDDETLVGEADDEGPTIVEPDPLDSGQPDGTAAPELGPGPTRAVRLEPSSATTLDSSPSSATTLERSATTETRVNAVRHVEPSRSARDKWVWGLPLLAFVIGAGLLAFVFVTRLSPQANVGGATPSDSRIPTPLVAATSASPMPTVSSTPAMDVETRDAGGAHAGGAGAGAAAAPPSESSGVESSLAPKPVHVKPPRPPAKPACDPPYTVDSQGVRVPKRECFAR